MILEILDTIEDEKFQSCLEDTGSADGGSPWFGFAEDDDQGDAKDSETSEDLTPENITEEPELVDDVLTLNSSAPQDGNSLVHSANQHNATKDVGSSSLEAMASPVTWNGASSLRKRKLSSDESMVVKKQRVDATPQTQRKNTSSQEELVEEDMLSQSGKWDN